MKKIAIILIALLALSVSCNKGKKSSGDEVIGKKYCILNMGVYQTKMQKKALKWMVRGESVSFLGTVKVTDKKGKTTEVAKVKLSSGEVGYATIRFLAEKPAVFLKDTRIYQSNNKTSRVITTIPRGALGFVVEEKAGWAKVWVNYFEKGKPKYQYHKWVNDGYSADEELMVDARIYEGILKTLSTPPEKLTEKQIKAVEKDIDDLAGKTNLFAELVTTSKESLTKIKEKMAELKQQKEEKKAADADNKGGDKKDEPK